MPPSVRSVLRRRANTSELNISQLASTPPLALPLRLVKQAFVNVEEKIDKVVGRRTRTPDAFKSGMRLQSLAVALHRSLRHHWAPKGVYRFKTHEEADEWMNRMLARSQKS
jgi:hypothetical protein